MGHLPPPPSASLERRQRAGSTQLPSTTLQRLQPTPRATSTVLSPDALTLYKQPTRVPAKIMNMSTDGAQIPQKPRQHFLNEAYPDPDHKDIQAVIRHPLSRSEATKLSNNTLEDVKVHLERTYAERREPILTPDAAKSSRKIRAAMRIVTLQNVTWELLHRAGDGENVRVADVVARARSTEGWKVLERWKVDTSNGDLVDEEGRPRFDAQGRKIVIIYRKPPCRPETS